MLANIWLPAETMQYVAEILVGIGVIVRNLWQALSLQTWLSKTLTF